MNRLKKEGRPPIFCAKTAGYRYKFLHVTGTQSQMLAFRTGATE